MAHYTLISISILCLLLFIYSRAYKWTTERPDQSRFQYIFFFHHHIVANLLYYSILKNYMVFSGRCRYDFAITLQLNSNSKFGSIAIIIVTKKHVKPKWLPTIVCAGACEWSIGVVKSNNSNHLILHNFSWVQLQVELKCIQLIYEIDAMIREVYDHVQRSVPVSHLIILKEKNLHRMVQR